MSEEVTGEYIIKTARPWQERAEKAEAALKDATAYAQRLTEENIKLELKMRALSAEVGLYRLGHVPANRRENAE